MSKAPYNPLEGDRPELTIDFKEHGVVDEQVSIVVVHRDRPEYLNLTLQSIAVTSINNNYEIIVVDNNSGQDSQDFLSDIEKDGIKVVRNDKNLYWAEAVNRGVQVANKSSKYIVVMHCDVVITNPSWLDLLMNVCESQGAGLVGLQMHSYLMQNQRVDFVEEWLVMLTRECWEDIGPWPTKLPQVGGAFIMTLRAQHKGHKPQIMKNNVAHHYRIFSLNINEYERFAEQASTMIPQLMRESQSEPVKKA